MIQQAFNGMLALMLVKFVLNDVPHAAGLHGNSVTLYHGTSKSIAAEALKEGLQPQPGVETEFPSTYLAYSPAEAAKYGEVVLKIRLPREELKYMQETIPGYMRTTHPIESKYISVHSGLASGSLASTGTCYPDAWRYVIQHPEGMLVHGTASSINTGVSKQIGHAWVELPYGTVWEPYSKRILPIEDFYRFTDAKPQDRYTAEEAAIMLARAGRHGPWSEDERRQYINR